MGQIWTNYWNQQKKLRISEKWSKYQAEFNEQADFVTKWLEETECHKIYLPYIPDNVLYSLISDLHKLIEDTDSEFQCADVYWRNILSHPEMYPVEEITLTKLRIHKMMELFKERLQLLESEQDMRKMPFWYSRYLHSTGYNTRSDQIGFYSGLSLVLAGLDQLRKTVLFRDCVDKYHAVVMIDKISQVKMIRCISRHKRLLMFSTVGLFIMTRPYVLRNSEMGNIVASYCCAYVITIKNLRNRPAR